MRISITDPLARAFEHMKAMLFEPFDLGKWLVVGFGCWLARLAGGGFGGVPTGTVNMGDKSSAATFADRAWPEVLRDQPWLLGCGALGGLLVAFILVLIPLLIWLSSRGHFIFLDNVVGGRAEIQQPWSRFATQGHSLFLWRLGFLFAAAFLLLLAVVPMIAVLFFLENRDSFAIGEVAAVALSVLPVVAVVVTLAYLHLFLIHFVVPIMHREGLNTNAAWGRFLPLLRANLGTFLIYGLFIVVLIISVTIGLATAVLLTCCIAAIPLVIPYISTVVLLPVYVVFRAYSVEFLSQLMPSVTLPPLAEDLASLRHPPAAGPRV